jgi:hypothetical protein
MRVRFGVVLAVAVALIATAAVDASSSGRVKFVKRADDICQVKINDAKRKIARGVRNLESRRLHRAGNNFAAAYRELRQGYRRVARLPRPVQGHRKIAKWLHREREATATGVQAAVALKNRNLEAAARLTAQSATLEHRAYRAVRSFDFKDCRPL